MAKVERRLDEAAAEFTATMDHWNVSPRPLASTVLEPSTTSASQLPMVWGPEMYMEGGTGLGGYCTVTHCRGVERTPPTTATTTPARRTRVESATAAEHVTEAAPVTEAGAIMPAPTEYEPRRTWSVVADTQEHCASVPKLSFSNTLRQGVLPLEPNKVPLLALPKDTSTLSPVEDICAVRRLGGALRPCTTTEVCGRPAATPKRNTIPPTTVTTLPPTSVLAEGRVALNV